MTAHPGEHCPARLSPAARADRDRGAEVLGVSRKALSRRPGRWQVRRFAGFHTWCSPSWPKAASAVLPDVLAAHADRACHRQPRGPGHACRPGESRLPSKSAMRTPALDYHARSGLTPSVSGSARSRGAVAGPRRLRLCRRRIRSITRSGFSIIRKWPPSGTYSIV